jgi:type VI secretion system secreted protein VgrG
MIVGNNEVSISSKKISISASEEIVIGVGPSSIKIDPTGVSTGGPKITSTAVGVHEISGALVKIN